MIQLLLQIAGAVAAGALTAGIGSYIGIKIGLARLQAQFATWVEAHHEQHHHVDFRLQRLESTYFKHSKANGETHYARE